MARTRPQSAALPACYAMCQPGLEDIAAEEIAAEFGGDIKRTAPGVVVFRVDPIDDHLLSIRTTEDIFLFAWGSDQLTHRAEDLDSIERWTRNADWSELLRLHHAIRPRSGGKPTYHLVTQMEGKHAYLRRDAGKSLARGLARHVPESWREADEDAAVEFWLTIDHNTAVCGLRLSDRTMRHRKYKLEHRPASLRPTVAAAMVRLAAARPGMTVLDPMCGAGTILAEQLAYSERFRDQAPPVHGGDIEFAAVKAATINLRRIGGPPLCHWDATRLPLPDACVDRIVCNPPFGKQLSTPEAVAPLYRRLVREYDRVLRPGGMAVLLTSETHALREPVREVGWKGQRQVRVRVLGQMAQIGVWRKRQALALEAQK